MNTVEIIRDETSVEVLNDKLSVETKLIPVETIQRGFMGLQTYEGVEPIDND